MTRSQRQHGVAGMLLDASRCRQQPRGRQHAAGMLLGMLLVLLGMLLVASRCRQQPRGRQHAAGMLLGASQVTRVCWRWRS